MEFKIIVIVSLVLSLGLSVYFVKTALDVYGNKDALYIAKQELVEAKEKRALYKDELYYTQTDEYIINEARQKLNYGFEGERIVIVPLDKEEETKNQPYHEENNVSFDDNIGEEKPNKDRPIIFDWMTVYLGI